MTQFKRQFMAHHDSHLAR